MAKRIFLMKFTAYRHRGIASYTVSEVKDKSTETVFHVNLETDRDPISIGKELPKGEVRKLISKYEKEFKRLPAPYEHDYKTAREVVRTVAGK